MKTDPTAFSFRAAQIDMAHGAGGEASRKLIEGLLAPALLRSHGHLNDAAYFAANGAQLALTTDSFVVKPLRFPGGSIGSLAVNGTVNDLAVSGARPIALTVSLILEAGLDRETLQREVVAMRSAAESAQVAIVAGDTKVVEHGKADGMYITTTGVGQVLKSSDLAAERVAAGDAVLISGPIGNHGVTIMMARDELDIQADIDSDSRPLTELTAALIDEFGTHVKWMRDATRGGVATVLNELAYDRRLQIELLDEEIPVENAVRGACELLGLDPLCVANEGQFIAVVSAEVAKDAVAKLTSLPGGAGAKQIGQVSARERARVVSHTAYGGSRIVDMLLGDPLPRIC